MAPPHILDVCRLTRLAAAAFRHAAVVPRHPILDPLSELLAHHQELHWPSGWIDGQTGFFAERLDHPVWNRIIVLELNVVLAGETRLVQHDSVKLRLEHRSQLTDRAPDELELAFAVAGHRSAGADRFRQKSRLPVRSLQYEDLRLARLPFDLHAECRADHLLQ